MLKGQLFTEKNISVQILTDNGIIVSAPQIVQSGFLIIHIPTIAERIHRAQRSSHRAGFADRITPCVITIFYHLCTVRVNDGDRVILKIVNIEVIRSVEAHHGRLALRVIEEMQVIATLRHVDDILAAQRVVGGHAIDDLLDTQTIVIIGELCIGASFHHAGQHAARLPYKRPAVIGQRIADGVVGNRLAADDRNLVLPVAITIVFQVLWISIACLGEIVSTRDY